MLSRVAMLFPVHTCLDTSTVSEPTKFTRALMISSGREGDAILCHRLHTLVNAMYLMHVVLVWHTCTPCCPIFLLYMHFIAATRLLGSLCCNGDWRSRSRQASTRQWVLCTASTKALCALCLPDAEKATPP
jgi:hypothetical protein